MIRGHRVMGKEGMTLAVLLAAAMFVTAFFLNTPLALTGQSGLCLPSPNEWGLPFIGGWILNTAVILAITVALYFSNKKYTFVQGPDTVLTGAFLVMTASNAWMSGFLTTSGMMALANLISLDILFGSYGKRNATQELFAIATILALGSMIQYAFLFMIPVYIAGAIMLKCFSLKALGAFLLGLIAPFWVGVGLGLIPPEAFRMPAITSFFDTTASKSDLFFGLLSVGVTAVLGLILALNNSVRLYAGNTRRRLFNMVINLLGFVAVVCLIVDFNNMLVYMATIYMITAVQLANLFALWDVNRGWLWLLTLAALYTAGFVLML